MSKFEHTRFYWLTCESQTGEILVGGPFRSRDAMKADVEQAVCAHLHRVMEMSLAQLLKFIPKKNVHPSSAYVTIGDRADTYDFLLA